MMVFNIKKEKKSEGEKQKDAFSKTQLQKL